MQILTWRLLFGIAFKLGMDIVKWIEHKNK